jgi:hypothetical protein
MAVKKKAKTGSSPYMTSSDIDELSPPDRMAHELVTGRSDLLPSIERIMSAGLSEDDTVEALTLFRTALDAPGDPNRDPRVALAAVAGSAPAT